VLDAGAPFDDAVLDIAAPGFAAWLRERRDGRAVTPRQRPSYGELGWQAHAAWLELVAGAARSERRPAGDGFAVISGVASNAENGVVASRLGPDAGAQVRELVTWFAAHDAPAQWLVGAETDPPDLRALLEREGCLSEDAAIVMGARLADLRPAAWGRARDVELAAVGDDATLEDWLDVAVTCVLDGDRERAAYRALLRGIDGPVHHVVARRAGRAVGLASWLVHGTTLRGLHLGVRPEARRQGIARTLAAAVARAGAEAGCEHVVLDPTPDSRALFAGLGLTTQGWPPGRTYYLPAGRGQMIS
jgi:ribosomal protein S18 acetylase RimI-like enzyme